MTIDKMVGKLYLDNAEGRLDNDRLRRMMADLEKESAGLKATLAELSVVSPAHEVEEAPVSGAVVYDEVEDIAAFRLDRHELHLAALAYLLAGVVAAVEDVIYEREVAVRRQPAERGQLRLRDRLRRDADARQGAARLISAVLV